MGLQTFLVTFASLISPVTTQTLENTSREVVEQVLKEYYRKSRKLALPSIYQINFLSSKASPNSPLLRTPGKSQRGAWAPNYHVARAANQILSCSNFRS